MILYLFSLLSLVSTGYGLPSAVRQAAPADCFKCHTRYHDSMCDATLDPASSALPLAVTRISGCQQGCSVTRYFVTDRAKEGHFRSCAGDNAGPITVPDSIPSSFNHSSGYLCKKWTLANVRYIACHCTTNYCNKESAAAVKRLNFTSQPDNIWFPYNPRNRTAISPTVTTTIVSSPNAVSMPQPQKIINDCYQCTDRFHCDTVAPGSTSLIICPLKNCRISYYGNGKGITRSCADEPEVPSRTPDEEKYTCLRHTTRPDGSLDSWFDCYCEGRRCNSEPASAFFALSLDSMSYHKEFEGHWFTFAPSIAPGTAPSVKMPNSSVTFQSFTNWTTQSTSSSSSPYAPTIPSATSKTTIALDHATSIAAHGFKGEASQCYRCAMDPFCENLLNLGTEPAATATCAAKSCSLTYIAGIGLARGCSYIVPSMEGLPFGSTTTHLPYLCRRIHDVPIGSVKAPTFECHCFSESYCNTHAGSAFLALNDDESGYAKFPPYVWFGFSPQALTTRRPPLTSSLEPPTTTQRLNYATLIPSVVYDGSADYCYRCLQMPTCSDLLHAEEARSVAKCAAKSCSVTYAPGNGLMRDCSYVSPGMEGVPFGSVTTGLVYLCKRLTSVAVNGKPQRVFECHCSNQAYCNVHPEMAFFDLINHEMFRGFPVNEWFGYDPLGPFITPAIPNINPPSTTTLAAVPNVPPTEPMLPVPSFSDHASSLGTETPLGTASSPLHMQFAGNATECHRCVTFPGCNKRPEAPTDPSGKVRCATRGCSVSYISDFGITRECSFMDLGVEDIPFGNLTTHKPYLCRRNADILVRSGNGYQSFECHCFSHSFCNSHAEAGFLLLGLDPIYSNYTINQWFGYAPEDVSANSSSDALAQSTDSQRSTTGIPEVENATDVQHQPDTIFLIDPQPQNPPSAFVPHQAAYNKDNLCFTLGNWMNLCWNWNFPYFSRQRNETAALSEVK